MFGRKGQSALEYLMTYGWAILIIIVVGGVLYYYGVFSPGKIVGESKVGFSKVQIDTWGVDAANDDLKVIFENRVGKDITITNVTVGTVANDGLAISLDAGEKSPSFVTLNSPAVDTGDSYKWDVTITYYIDEYGSSDTFTSTGMLSGTA